MRAERRYSALWFVVLQIISIVACGTSLADDTRPAVTLATNAEVIQAVKVNPAPKIDGVLDDHCWTVASTVTGFEYEGKEPLQKTIVYFCYDEDKLYFAFDAKDDQPGQIRAQQKKRNGNLWDDDVVEVDIDCLHDHQTFYWFAVNARGTQCERIPGGSASKIEWRGDWKAETKINSDGWTAEIEVPFKILRYPKGQDTFGIHFYRHLQRAREWYKYPRMGEVWDPKKLIDWTGLETPVIKRRFTYMPYTLVQAGEDGGITTGMDIKRTFDNNISTAITIKPDFGTIEQSVGSVDFTYDPQYLDDNRPFFTEGQRHFNESRLFYPRSVETIDAGAKAFGKIGPNSFGVMAFSDPGKLGAQYVSYAWEPNEDFVAAMHALNCRGPEMDSTVTKNYAILRTNHATGGTDFTANYYRSFDRMNSKDGMCYSLHCNYWRTPGHTGIRVGYEDKSPDFTTPLGYIILPGTRAAWIGLGYYDQYDNGTVRHWDWNVNSWVTKWYGGDPYNRGIGLDASISLRNRTGAWFSFVHDNHVPHHNNVWTVGLSWGHGDIYRGGNISTRWGRQDGADYRFYSLWQGFKLNDRLSANLHGELLDMDYPAGSDAEDSYRSQIYASLAYDLTSEKGLGLGVRAQDGKTNAFLTYRQELRLGTDIFLLWGDPNADSTANLLSVKMIKVL